MKAAVRREFRVQSSEFRKRRKSRNDLDAFRPPTSDLPELRTLNSELRTLRMGFFSKTLDKLKGAVKKTAAVLNTDVRTLFIPGRQIDDAFLIEMEEKFLKADMGIRSVEPMVAAVRDRWRLGKIKNAEDAERIVKEQM